MAKKKERKPEEIDNLDYAISVFADWRREIEEELSKRGYGESYLGQTLDAAHRVTCRLTTKD